MPLDSKNTINGLLEELKQEVLSDQDKVKPEMRCHWEKSVEEILQQARQRIIEETDWVNK